MVNPNQVAESWFFEPANSAAMWSYVIHVALFWALGDPGPTLLMPIQMQSMFGDGWRATHRWEQCRWCGPSLCLGLAFCKSCDRFSLFATCALTDVDVPIAVFMQAHLLIKSRASGIDVAFRNTNLPLQDDRQGCSKGWCDSSSTFSQPFLLYFESFNAYSSRFRDLPSCQVENCNPLTMLMHQMTLLRCQLACKCSTPIVATICHGKHYLFMCLMCLQGSKYVSFVLHFK